MLCWVLTGCVGGDDGLAAFAGHDNSSALLVRWTDNGKGMLSGSVQIAEKAPGVSGAAIKQTTLPFSGRLKSGKVSLAVQQEFGDTQTWNGTLDGDELQVDVPQGAGSVETITLSRGSVREFGDDVAELEAAVVKARDEATRAAASADQIAAKKEAEAAVRRSFDDAVSDLSIAKETVLALLLDPPELKALTEDLDAARSDLARVKAAAAEAVLRTPRFVACEFASQAQAASSDAASEASSLKDDARAINRRADDLADARDELSRAFARLQQLSERGGQSSKMGSAALTTLIDEARGTSEEWRTAAREAEGKMKTIASQANKLASDATRAAC